MVASESNNHRTVYTIHLHFKEGIAPMINQNFHLQKQDKLRANWTQSKQK